MTPIRVRGKKRSQRSSVKPNQYGRRSELESPKRRLVRRDRMIDISGANRSCSTTMPSHLERLPAEILQMVFLECLNLNLPRASPMLASTLSSFYIKSQLFFIAFSLENTTLRHEEQLMRILKSSAAIAKLQSEILQLRWMTLDFFHQCIPLYLKKEFHRTSKLSRLDHSDETLTGSLSKETAPIFITDSHEVESRMIIGTEIIERQYKQWWFGTSDSFVSITSPQGWVNLHPPFKCEMHLGKILHCEKGCAIPEKLLRGPWTLSQCEFLESLLHAGATIDWIGSTAGEVADLGFQDALKEQSMRAIRILIQPFDLWYDDSQFHFFRGLSDPIISPDGSGLGFRPTSRHLKMAAVDYDCSLEILRIIKFAGRFDLVVNRNGAERALFAWAEQKKSEGDSRGLWLSNTFYAMYSEHWGEAEGGGLGGHRWR